VTPSLRRADPPKFAEMATEDFEELCCDLLDKEPGVAAPISIISTRCPNSAGLQTFGEAREIGGPAVVRAILEKVADALAETLPEMAAYAKDRPALGEVAGRIQVAGEEGLSDSFGGASRT